MNDSMSKVDGIQFISKDGTERGIHGRSSSVDTHDRVAGKCMRSADHKAYQHCISLENQPEQVCVIHTGTLVDSHGPRDAFAELGEHPAA